MMVPVVVVVVVFISQSWSAVLASVGASPLLATIFERLHLRSVFLLFPSLYFCLSYLSLPHLFLCLSLSLPPPPLSSLSLCAARLSPAGLD